MRGFSTLEILLALTIVTITVVAVTTVSFGTPVMEADAKVEEVAYQRAELLLEQEELLARTTFDSVIARATTTADGYASALAVEHIDDVTSRVSSRVAWTSAMGTAKYLAIPLIVTDVKNAGGREPCDATLSGNWKAPAVTTRTFAAGDLLPSPLSNTPVFASTTLAVTPTVLFLATQSSQKQSDATIFLFDISDPLAPHYESAIDNVPSTVGPAALAAQGNYLYVASGSTCTQGTCGQLQIIDASDKTHPTITGHLLLATSSAPSAADSAGRPVAVRSIAYHGGFVYLGLEKTTGTVGDEFTVIDVSDPRTPVWRGGLHMGNTVTSIAISGTRAYVTTTDNTSAGSALRVLDVHDPAHPVFEKGYAQAGAGFAEKILHTGDALYLGRSSALNSKEFYRFDASTTPMLLASGSADTNTSVRDMRVRDSYAFVLTATELEFWDVSAPVLAPAQHPLPFSVGQKGTALSCRGNVLYAASVDESAQGFLTMLTGS